MSLMIKIKYTKRFKKKYKKLIAKNPKLRRRFSSQIDKFIRDYRIGGIHSHKVIINGEEAFVFKLTGDLRVAYRWEDGVPMFFDIGDHDELYT